MNTLPNCEICNGQRMIFRKIPSSILKNDDGTSKMIDVGTPCICVAQIAYDTLFEPLKKKYMIHDPDSKNSKINKIIVSAIEKESNGEFPQNNIFFFSERDLFWSFSIRYVWEWIKKHNGAIPEVSMVTDASFEDWWWNKKESEIGDVEKSDIVIVLLGVIQDPKSNNAGVFTESIARCVESGCKVLIGYNGRRSNLHKYLGEKVEKNEELNKGYFQKKIEYENNTDIDVFFNNNFSFWYYGYDTSTKGFKVLQKDNRNSFKLISEMSKEEKNRYLK